MSKTALHIETDEDRYQFGDNITVRVRDENGNPVAGGTVQSSTGITEKTGSTHIVGISTAMATSNNRGNRSPSRIRMMGS